MEKQGDFLEMDGKMISAGLYYINFCGIFAYSFKGKFYGRSPAYL